MAEPLQWTSHSSQSSTPLHRFGAYPHPQSHPSDGRPHPYPLPRRLEHDSAAPGQHHSVSPPQAQAVEHAQDNGPHVRRRSKVHTPNACSNCKRAHLGCDSQRPCKRCILASKQATCVDVPQKKRGRPRLRANTLMSASHMDIRGTPQPANDDVEAAAQRGPIRMSPMRLSPTDRATPKTPHVQSRQDPHVNLAITNLRETVIPPRSSNAGGLFQPSRFGPTVARPSVTPMLFMDLDLNLLKANEGYSRIHGHVDGRGLVLQDMASSTIPETFQQIRNRLRDEREAKDPVYMPPITIPGEDFLGPLETFDVEKAVEGFEPINHRLIFNLPNGVLQKLSAKFTLARTSRYFAIMTLPALTPEYFEVIANHAGPSRHAQGSSHSPVGPLGFASLFSDSRVANVLNSTDDGLDDLDDYGGISATAPPDEKEKVPDRPSDQQPSAQQPPPASSISLNPSARVGDSHTGTPPHHPLQTISASPRTAATPLPQTLTSSSAPLGSPFARPRALSRETSLLPRAGLLWRPAAAGDAPGSASTTDSPWSRPLGSTIPAVRRSETASTTATQTDDGSYDDKRRRMDIDSLLH